MKRTLSYLKPYSGGLALGMTVKIVGSAAELVLPYILSYIIDELTPLKDSGRIYLMGGVMLFFALVALGGNIWANRLSAKVAGNMTHDIRYDLFKKTSYLKCRQVDEVTVPSLISRLTSDTYYVNQMVARTMRMGVRAPILLLGGLVFCFLLNVRLALVLLAVVPVVAVPMWLITRKSIPMYSAVQRRGDNMVRSVQEDIATEAYTVAESYGTISGPSVNFMNNLSLALISVFGAIMYMTGVIPSVGKIASFVLYSRKFSGPINEIANVLSEFQSALAAAERAFRVLEEGPESPDTEGAEELRDVRGDVEIEHLRFGYTPGKVVINDFSLKASAGDVVAIVGHTGAGKTTIINLLMRFYDAQSGTIKIDGHDITEVTRASLRSSFTMVLQDTWLFSGTIYENVAYGSENVTREDVERVCRAAKIHSFISKLPGGYDTVLTDNAVNISKGQKQLLTIARAMLSPSPMLILDEATSNVDTRTEQYIQQAMEELMRGRTCFVIAHRLSTIKHAKTIIVMDHGDVVEQGTHEELMARGGYYAKLYYSQFDAAE